MKIELWDIERVTSYEKNPRVNEAAVGPVAASIREFGFLQAIVVDRDGVIVVGHTRWRAAKVPVHVAEHLTPDQAKAYRIADNELATIAEWDKALPTVELSELQGGNE